MPDLLASEKKRNYCIMFAVVIVLFAHLAVLVAFVLSGIDLSIAATLILLIWLATWCLFKGIYRYIKVTCPNCCAPIEGNYANSPRYSDTHVQHSCDTCGNRYIDGVLKN